MKIVNLSLIYPYIEELMSNLRDEVKQKDRSLFSKSVHALGQFLGVELSNSLSYDKK